MRSLTLMLVLLLGAVAWPPAVQAQQNDRAWDDCAQDQDLDRQLTGCSEILGRGNRETAANRAAAFYNRGFARIFRGSVESGLHDLD
jgi:hypothetical protein